MDEMEYLYLSATSMYLLIATHKIFPSPTEFSKKYFLSIFFPSYSTLSSIK